MLQSFGSYLAFIIRFTGLILGGFQKHSIDNSMIKKLYSAKTEKKDSENQPKSVEFEETAADPFSN